MKKKVFGDWDSVLIHIGLPRCASTYLQDVIFPELPIDIFDKWGNDRYKLKNEIYELIRSDKYDEKVFSDWVLKNTEKKNNTLVISQETLGWDSEAYTTGKNLHNTFPDAKILIIIREQISFLISNYCYKVTTGNFHESRTINEYLIHLDEINYFDMLEYNRIIKYYQSLFGKEKIHVLPLEMLSKKPASFHKYLFDLVNIEEIPLNNKISKENYSIRRDKVINAMIMANKGFDCTYEIFKKCKPSAYMDNKFKYCYYTIKKPMAYFFDKIYQKDPKLLEINDSWKKRLETRFKESNKKLNDIIDIPLKEYSYIL